MDQITRAASPATTRRRRGERTRTIPEQIADAVSTAIIDGDYRGGERVREQELADTYGVSRGPVREAIRELQQRGLVTLYPRRGAYVVEVTLDTIVEVFNVRASLMGLAARHVARRKDAALLTELEAGIAEIAALAKVKGTAAQVFARAVARLGGLVAARCGNRHLSRLLRDQLEHTLWGAIWRDRALDFLTPKRQQAAVLEWQAVAAAIRGGRDRAAEQAMKDVFYNARDAALATLQKARGGRIDRAGLIRD
jgi:DNA-binding GntR family transcriptional regulator